MIWSRCRRLSVIGLLSLVYVLFLLRDASETLHNALFLDAFLHTGLSAMIGLMFLVVGSVVWLYASSRRLALIFLCFTFSSALLFVVQTAALAGDFALSEVSSICSGLALAFMSMFFLLFPHNVLAPSAVSSLHRESESLPSDLHRRGLPLLMCAYLVCVCLVGSVVVCESIFYFASLQPNPLWLHTLTQGYTVLGLFGSIMSLGLSLRQATTQRERQQARFLVVGVCIAVLPVCCLTLLPLLFHRPAMMGSQYSTLTFCILPVELGYAILRFQLLVLDRQVKKVLSAILGVLCLFLLAFFLFSFSVAITPHDLAAQAGVVVLGMSTLGTCTWWSIQVVTNRLLFSESRNVVSSIEDSLPLTRKVFEVHEAASLLIKGVKDHLQPSSVCLFVLDEEWGCYRPYFSSLGFPNADQLLLQQVLSVLKPDMVGENRHAFLDVQDSALMRLVDSKRPLLLSQLCQSQQGSLPLILDSTFDEGTNPLLAPLTLRKKLIGVLVLGARKDNEAYAGPDFELLESMFAHFSFILESARLHTLDNTYARLVMQLFQNVPRKPVEHFHTLGEIEQRYATIASSVTSSRAELWSLDEQGESVLRKRAQAGQGPSLIHETSLSVERMVPEAFASCFVAHADRRFPYRQVDQVQDEDEQTRRENSEEMNVRKRFPLAWLPFIRDHKLHGVLILTYTRPHAFPEQERLLLSLLAQQCASALEYARQTLDQQRLYTSHIAQDKSREAYQQQALEEIARVFNTFTGSLELLEDSVGVIGSVGRFPVFRQALLAAHELSLLAHSLYDKEYGEIIHHDPFWTSSSLLLGEMIQNTLELRQGYFLRNEVAVDVVIPAEMSVREVPRRLHLVLFSLLNAVLSYFPVSCSIRMQIEAVNEGIRLWIHGIGSKNFHDPLAGKWDVVDLVNSRFQFYLQMSQELSSSMGSSLTLEDSDLNGECSLTFCLTISANTSPDPLQVM